MLNFVCINAANYCAQGKQYVEILYDSVSRNLKYGTEAKFVCFTDDSDPYHERIEKRPLPNPELSGWWHKLSLFKKGVFDPEDRIIYLDLDTVIVGGLDDIISYQGDFAILQDVYRDGGFQSSVMMWKQSECYGLWNYFGLAPRYFCESLTGGDQSFIENFFEMKQQSPDILQKIYPDCFKSYKVDCKTGVKKGTKVVFFHGSPRPHEVGGWVRSVWKVGGGTSLELEMVSAVSAEKLEENVRHTISLNLPTLDTMGEFNEARAILVGGGPSLADHISEMKVRQQCGEKIFALNGALKFLEDNGLVADYHVIADARPENAAFVPENSSATLLYSSHCDPAVIDKSLSQKPLIWHLGHEGMREIVNPGFTKKDAYIAGGGTVGLIAMSLAYTLGFRKLELFGYDSSYADDKGHAYEQELNAKDKVIDVELYDRAFKTTAWMVDQVNDFGALANALIELGCEINVHGTGLLPYLAQIMATSLELEDEITEIDGLWWPKHDLECRHSILGSFDDIKAILMYCSNFDTVVQAGGNVGVWPKELSKHFKAVYTFEPDNINFQCLSRNVNEMNVVKMQAALGDKPGLICLVKQRTNCGAHFVQPNVQGIVPTLRIDDLGLTSCNLIQFDIEGFELFALQGAKNTIEKFKPVIVVEEKGLGEKYGVEEEAVSGLLATLGYKFADKFHRDVVYIPT